MNPKKSEVIVQSLEQRSLELAIDEIMKRCPLLKKNVLIKGNMYGFPYRKGITTHPQVLTTVANYLSEKGHRVFLGDIIPLKEIDFSKYFEGYDVPKEVTFVNLNDETDLIETHSGKFRFRFPKLLYDADIVNIPVLKTHSETLLSCAIKNMMGVLPKTIDRENIHKINLGEGIKRLYSTVGDRIKFNVVDGIYVMEGNGPVFGEVKPGNFVFGGSDPTCVDSYANSLVESSFQPTYIGELKEYILFGDNVNVKLRMPDQLEEKYYTGNPSLGDKGVFATMLGAIVDKIGSNINFVFPGGESIFGKTNVGVNVSGYDYLVSGCPPSRREIRRVFEIEKR